jgi:hypothetical protein
MRNLMSLKWQVLYIKWIGFLRRIQIWNQFLHRCFATLAKARGQEWGYMTLPKWHIYQKDCNLKDNSDLWWEFHHFLLWILSTKGNINSAHNMLCICLSKINYKFIEWGIDSRRKKCLTNHEPILLMTKHGLSVMSLTLSIILMSEDFLNSPWIVPEESLSSP